MKRKNSESLFEQAQSLMPGGVNSPGRAFKNVNGKPIFFKSAKEKLMDEIYIKKIYRKKNNFFNKINL